MVPLIIFLKDYFDNLPKNLQDSYGVQDYFEFALKKILTD